MSGINKSSFKQPYRGFDSIEHARIWIDFVSGLPARFQYLMPKESTTINSWKKDDSGRKGNPTPFELCIKYAKYTYNIQSDLHLYMAMRDILRDLIKEYQTIEKGCDYMVKALEKKYDCYIDKED